MQFRYQARKILCLRSVYNKEKKKCVQHLIVSFPRYETTITADVKALLTEDEQKQLTKWLDEKQKTSDKNTAEYYILSSPRLLIETADAIENSELMEDQASEIWEAMAALAKALKKAGHPKPAKQHAQPPEQPGQGDLLG